LEQIRKGKPAPVLFHSRLLILDLIDEISCSNTDHNRASIRSFLNDSAGQARQDQPYHKAAAVITGAQTS
jgi:hypothetical protein